MSETEDRRQVMKWIWAQMHDSNPKLPRDAVIFEGDNDLAFLYQSGFVDTDTYSYEKWHAAFRPHRQKDTTYKLSLDEWLAKTPFRYFGPVPPPFNPKEMREGEWTEQEYTQFAKEKLLPEMTMTYEQFLKGVAEAKREGKIVNGVIIVTAEIKRELTELMDQYASPKRRRALAVAKMPGQQDELDKTTAAQTPASNAAKPVSKVAVSTGYKGGPDESKQSTSKLSDLLSGGKK